MSTFDRSRARAWLREMRGDMSQAELAADITATTGWTITRDRYSKYESGSATSPMGREVFQHFIDYWTSKGHPAPNMEPPAPEVSLEERAVMAAEEANRIALAQLDATRAQTVALQALLLGSLSPDEETRARLLPYVAEVESAIPTRSSDPTSAHHATPAR